MNKDLLVYTALAALTSPAIAQAAPPLSKAEASHIVGAAHAVNGLNRGCFPLTVSDVKTKDSWSLVAASCRTNPDASINAVLRFDNGKWRFSCSHGDDVMPAQEAVKRCGMTLSEAKALGFTL